MGGILTENQVFVDALRGALGLQPLYRQRPDEPCGPYVSRERYRRLAKPDCKTCGGSGYYDGWICDARCACTGLPQRDTRAKKQRTKGQRRYPMRGYG